MKYRDPKPDIQRIEEIVTAVKQGDIKLPKFQRPFVWRRKEVLNLLDSIYNGYPIGSILIWNSNERLESERTIADLDLYSQEKYYYPTNYLLDGQQRISCLCGTLYWDNKDYRSLWNVVFDLDKERFIYPKNEKLFEYFPLNKLINTSDFITQCRSFESHPKSEKFFKNAEKLLRSIKDYKIAVVKIGEMTIQEVAPIFERINSTGRKLTMVDLMRAATWKENFDLNDAINNIKSECETLGFYNISDSHIVRNISACAGYGINKEDIDKLRYESSEILKISTNKCLVGYQKALQFLKAQIGLPSILFLPYSLQLTLLVEYFNLSHEPSDKDLASLKQWFWRTSISRYFGTSNTGQNTRDLKAIRDFALRIKDDILFETKISVDKFLNDEFRLSTSNSKTFILLLSLFKPRDLVSGTLIDSDFYLINSNRSYYQTFFGLKNCINYYISYPKSDSEELKRSFEQNPYELSSSVYQSHFIDETGYSLFIEKRYEEFLLNRKKLITQALQTLLNMTDLNDPIEYDIYSDYDRDELE